jgi:hypothetical protein
MALETSSPRVVHDNHLMEKGLIEKYNIQDPTQLWESNTLNIFLSDSNAVDH